MDILVDTSVWIDFLNKKTFSAEAKILHDFLQSARDNIWLCPIIYQELLQGFRNDKVFAEIKNILLNFSMLDFDIVTVSNYAIDLYRHLRKKGSTIRKSADCLIAAYAILADLSLLHKDKDFAQIAKHSPLKIYRL
jgi:predicted nucleic acid-binding protein